MKPRVILVHSVHIRIQFQTEAGPCNSGAICDDESPDHLTKDKDRYNSSEMSIPLLTCALERSH